MVLMKLEEDNFSRYRKTWTIPKNRNPSKKIVNNIIHRINKEKIILLRKPVK